MFQVRMLNWCSYQIEYLLRCENVWHQYFREIGANLNSCSTFDHFVFKMASSGSDFQNKEAENDHHLLREIYLLSLLLSQ